MSPFDVISRFGDHDLSLTALLASRSRAQGDKEFLRFGDRSMSYAAFERAVNAAATGLAKRGIPRGTRVGAILPNYPALPVLLFALARLGAILVPVNPELGEDEAFGILDHTQVAGIVAAPGSLALAHAVAKRLQPTPWVAEQEEWPAAPDDIAPVGTTEDLAQATCVIVTTSGTTGRPKGVMHSQRNILLAGQAFVERLHTQPEERVLCVLPMHHINAIFYSLAGTLAAGATLILEERFSASRFWPLVAAGGATQVNLIGAAARILALRPRSEFVASHTLTKVFGGPFDAETRAVFETEFGIPHLLEGYGMTEIPGGFNNPFAGERRPGSMGLPSRHPDPALTLTESRIVDTDGAPVATDVVGELQVRTPILMQGYWRDPDATAAAFRDGWFATGDLVRRDADGYHWFVGRQKDIIRRRGENIAGAELDRVIGEHPAVLEVAAVPVPSPLSEDDILAAIVLRPGMTLDPRELARWCAARLAAFKVPRYVAIIDALPHTPTHRIAKFRVRDDPAIRAAAVDLGETRQAEPPGRGFAAN